MAASFPGAVRNFSAVVNGITNLVASLFNSPYDEITAIETALGANMSNVRLGAWDATKSTGTVYQAATDGVVHVVGALNNASGSITGYSGADNPPTGVRQYVYDDPSTNHAHSIVFFVVKNDYWKVTMDTWTATVFWLPIGG